jgi:ribosome-associated heat shock protein Hsp15
MRIDLYLKRCGLMKHRSLAKRACDNGIVRIEGVRAKPSKEVHSGQHIAIHFRDRLLQIEVSGIPGNSVRKKEAEQFYHILSDEPKSPSPF